MRIWRDVAQNPEMLVKVQQGFIDCPDAPDDFALEMLCVTANIESLTPHCLAVPLRHSPRAMRSRRGCNTKGQTRNEKKICVGVCIAYKNLSANS